MHGVPLSKIATIYDGPHATPKKIKDGAIYLGLDGVNERGELIPEGFNYLSEDDFKKWTKRVTPTENDIVFSYEASLHRYAIIPKNFHGCLGRRLGLVRVTDTSSVNPKWLFYYFLSPNWRILMEKNTVKGSTVNRISVDKFSNFTIPLPPKEKQDKIVEILENIDKLISNNKKTITTCYNYVFSLFDHWFLQYDFPEKSNCNLKYDNKLKAKIPSEWDSCALGDFIGSDYGGAWGSDKETERYADEVFCIRGADFPSVTGTMKPNLPIRYIGKTDLKRLVKDGDLIVEVSGNPGRIVYINEATAKRFGDKIIASNFCRPFSLKNKEQSIWFYILWQKLYDEGVFERFSGKTTIANLLFDLVCKNLYVIKPSDDLIKEFDVIAHQSFITVQEKLNENDKLFNIRNDILPSIISSIS